MKEKCFHLFRGKMPHTVNFLAVKKAGGYIIADSAVGESRKKHDMAYGIKIALCAEIVHCNTCMI